MRPDAAAETRSCRPQYRSHNYRSSSHPTAAVTGPTAATFASTTVRHPSAAEVRTTPTPTRRDGDVLSSAPTEEAAAVPTPEPATAAAAAPNPGEEAAAEDDEYEEVEEVEEVEEAETDAPSQATAAASPSEKTAQSAKEEGSAAAVSPAADDHVHAAPPAHPAATYQAAHTKDSGAMTLESENRYATARFVRDGSLAAAEVQEVSRVGDFDVLRRTQQMQGSTDAGDARTTLSATNTTGAFRSTSGDVTGTFAYRRTTTVTESSSLAAASAAAAAASLPVRHEDAASATPSDEDVESILEAKATAVKDVEDVGEKEVEVAEEEAEEAEAEVVTTAAATAGGEAAKRKRASGSGKGKKKGGSKKVKKSSKRKASSKTSPKAEMMTF